MDVDESSQLDQSSSAQSSDESGSLQSFAVGARVGGGGSSTVPHWCRGPAYDRYWKHRQSVEQWFQRHTGTEDAENYARRHDMLHHSPAVPPYYQHNMYNQSPMANHYYHLMMYWHQRYHRLLSEFQSEPSAIHRHDYPWRNPGRGQHYHPSDLSAANLNQSPVSQSSYTSNEQPKNSSRKRNKNSNSRRRARQGRIHAKLAKKESGRIEVDGTTFQNEQDMAEGYVHGSDIIFDVDPKLLHGSQDEDEALECHMEITDEMLEFFAQSAIHRKERDAKKMEEQECEKAPQAEFVDISKADTNKAAPSSAAPVSRPGAQRTAEMKQLYGRGAAMIHGMETAMQLTYDRQLDLTRPKHWPHLPLNITFMQ